MCNSKSVSWGIGRCSIAFFFWLFLVGTLSALELSANRLTKNGAYWFEVSPGGRYVAYLGEDGYAKGAKGNLYARMRLYLLDLNTGKTEVLDTVGTDSDTVYIEDMRFSWDDSALCYMLGENMRLLKKTVFNLSNGFQQDVGITNSCVWKADNTQPIFNVLGSSVLDSGEISPERRSVIAEAMGYISEYQEDRSEAAVQSLSDGNVNRFEEVFSPVWGANDDAVYYLSRSTEALAVNLLNPGTGKRAPVYTLDIPEDPERPYWLASQKYLPGTGGILLALNLSALPNIPEGESGSLVQNVPGVRLLFYVIDPSAGKGRLFFETQMSARAAFADGLSAEAPPKAKFAIVTINSVGIYKFDFSSGTTEKIALYCQELGPVSKVIKLEAPQIKPYHRRRSLVLVSDTRAVTNYGGPISQITFDDEMGVRSLKAVIDAQSRPEVRPVDPSCARFAGSTRHLDLGDEGGVSYATVTGQDGVAYHRVFTPPVLSTSVVMHGLTPGRYELKSADGAGNESSFCFEIIDLNADVSIGTPPGASAGFFDSYIHVAIQSGAPIVSVALIKDGVLAEVKEKEALTDVRGLYLPVKPGIWPADYVLQVVDAQGNCVQREFTLKRRLVLGSLEITKSSINTKRTVYIGEQVPVVFGNDVFSTFEGVSRAGDVLLDLGKNERIPKGYVSPVNRTFTLTMSPSLAFKSVRFEVPYEVENPGIPERITPQILRLAKKPGSTNTILPSKFSGDKIEFTVSPEDLGTFAVVFPAVQR